MIKVTYTEKGKKFSLRVEGHAGYAERGNDIVCASASILAYTLAQIVSDIERYGNLAFPTVVQMDSGDAFISCEAYDDADLMVLKSMFTFAIRGYALLAHNYPQYVEIITDD